LMLLLLRIFKVALLFICQGSFLSFSATALLEYHSFFALSTSFLIFFNVFSEVQFQNFFTVILFRHFKKHLVMRFPQQRM